MRLLFDQNLSRALVGAVRDVFSDSRHVTSLGLDTATDCEIWEYARDHAHIVASKTPTSVSSPFLHGPPPKVLWLRVGSASTAAVIRVLLERIDAIEAFAMSEVEAMLVLPGIPG